MLDLSHSSPQLTGEPWFLREPRPSARCSLFMLHHAGGSSLYYTKMAKLMGPQIDPVLLELPGRGRRYHENAVTDLSVLVELIIRAMMPLLAKPYVIFGHSMGGYLGHRLIARIEELGLPKPFLFVISASQNPFRPFQNRSSLPKAEFLDYVKSLKGMPPEVMDSPDFMDFIYPIFRNDYLLCEAGFREHPPVLSVPLLYAYGDQDRFDASDVEGWRSATSGDYDSKVFAGGHFYFEEYLVDYVGWLERICLDRLRKELK